MMNIIGFVFKIFEGRLKAQLTLDFVNLIYYLVLILMFDTLEIFIKLFYCEFTLGFFKINERISFKSFIFSGKAIDQILFLFVLSFITTKNYYWRLFVINQIYINYFDRSAYLD